MSEISLKEYFDNKLATLELFLEKQRQSDLRALDLQAREYERRLIILNNEHARVDKIVTTKVDRNEWDAYHQAALRSDFIPRIEFSAYKEQNIRDRALSIGEVQGAAKVTAMFYSLVVLVLSFLAVLSDFIWHR